MDELEDFDQDDRGILKELFRDFFIVMDASEADQRMYLNNFNAIPIDDKNCFIQYMIKVVYGIDIVHPHWHDNMQQFINIWGTWITHVWEVKGEFPCIVPKGSSLLN